MFLGVLFFLSGAIGKDIKKMTRNGMFHQAQSLGLSKPGLQCPRIKSFLFLALKGHHKRALMTTSSKPVYGNGFCSAIEEFQKCFLVNKDCFGKKGVCGNHIYKIRAEAK